MIRILGFCWSGDSLFHLVDVELTCSFEFLHENIFGYIESVLIAVVMIN